MTKKNFIALADAIRDHNRSVVVQDHFSDEQLQTLARFCLVQNPRFNRSRWLGYIAGTNGQNGGQVK